MQSVWEMRVSAASTSASEMRTYVAAYVAAYVPDAGIRYHQKLAAPIPFERNYGSEMQSVLEMRVSAASTSASEMRTYVAAYVAAYVPDAGPRRMQVIAL
ncbi:MAG: hypothetical protein ABL921_27715 [Pirellula sp.]